MIPSLLQIPSAVSDSKLHSVLPNNGKGDFQFDRSTGATRINRDGLIEEVGYFSSELVQNGNFSELGSELVTNGDFSNGTTGWNSAIYNSELSIDNGQLKITNTSSRARAIQGITTIVGKTYKFQASFRNGDVAAGIRLKLSNTFNLDSAFYNSSLNTTTDFVTTTHYFTATATTTYLGTDAQGSVGTISFLDNVSVKQVDPNDRWTLVSTKFTGANTFENTATNGRIFQSFTTIVGSKYKVSVTINSGTWNVVASTTNNTSGTIQSTGNTTTSEFFEFTATGTTTFLVLYNIGASGSVASITDVSVVEVQGDRPRLSYDITNGVVEDKPHLLLENSSTNFATFSEDFSQSVWLKTRATITTNQITSPDGTLSASFQAETTDNNSHFVFFNYTTSVASYTFSVFVKYKNRQYVQFTKGGGASGYANFDILNGTTANFGGAYTSTKIENYGNGWYRCSGTFTGASEAMNFGVCNILTNVSSRFENYTGDVNSGFYIWGAMFEQNSFSTSYIKTAGTTITRAAETCNNSKPSVNSTEGVLYAEIAALADDSTNRQMTLSDGSNNNRLVLKYDNQSNVIQAFNRVGGVETAFLSASVTDITLFSKCALKYKANDYALWIDGLEVATDTSSTTFSSSTLNDFKFGDSGSGSNFYGKVKGLAVYNEALSESQLMQLTGVTASSIYSNFVTRTASFTVEALNEVKKVIDNL